MKVIRLSIAIVIALAFPACSGEDSEGPGGADESSEDQGRDSSDLADPCSLIDQATLDSLFTESVAPVPSGSGRFVSCVWSDSNANSILVSVADSSDVDRPDECPGCIDLTYGDDGFATAVSLQASATFVTGGAWYSVTTTGLNQGVDDVAALGELVYNEVSG